MILNKIKYSILRVIRIKSKILKVIKILIVNNIFFILKVNMMVREDFVSSV